MIHRLAQNNEDIGWDIANEEKKTLLVKENERQKENESKGKKGEILRYQPEKTRLLLREREFSFLFLFYIYIYI